MSAFDIEKGGQHAAGMPQPPVPATHPDGAFLPVYEQAVNTNLRNFNPLEGYAGKGAYERTKGAHKKSVTWKRCLFIGLPLLLVLAMAVAGGFAISNYPEQFSEHTSTTITHTRTMFETSTISASIPASIADAASSFHDEQSTLTSTVSSGSESVGPSLITTIAHAPNINTIQVRTTPPVPSINMSPVSSSLNPIATPPSSSKLTDRSRLNRRGVDDVRFGDRCLSAFDHALARRSAATLNKTMYITVTVTSTTSTTAAIPMSILNAASSFYEAWSSSIASEMSDVSEHLTPTFTTSVPLPSIDLSATASTPAPMSTTTTTSTATSSTSLATIDPLGDGFCGLPGTFCSGGKRDADP